MSRLDEEERMKTKTGKMILVPTGTFERGSPLSPDEQPPNQLYWQSIIGVSLGGELLGSPDVSHGSFGV